jgi:hypothetical protein
MEADQFFAVKERLRTLGEIIRHETLRSGSPEVPRDRIHVAED